MPTQRLRDAAFPPVHEPLRVDVGFLGDLLGQVIRDQGGDTLFSAVETARHSAIHRRERDKPVAALAETLSGLDVAEATGLVQAFSIYFSLTNLAEQVHRIRRRRDYQLEGRPQPGSLEAVFASLADLDPARVREAMDRLNVVPVLTAHPTEATRRTLLKKEQRIARALVDRIEQPRRTPAEDRRIIERIRAEIGLIWQTAEQASIRPTVADEVEHVLFFLTEVVYRIVPPFREALDQAAANVLPTAGDGPGRPVVRFGSWVGGDMDGNPNVGADTLIATLTRQRGLILQRYRAEVRELFEHLSQTEGRTEVADAVLARCRDYETRFPETAREIPARYADMPYRVLLWMVWHRLGLTRAQDPQGYTGPEDLIGDLERIDASLTTHHGARAGRARVRRLLIRVRTFGFHLASLDLRQDARVHREVLGQLLGDAQFPERSAGERTGILEAALGAPPAVGEVADEETVRRTLDVYRAITTAHASFGEQAMGPFIISMAQGPDDVLAVLALARIAGLGQEGQVPLDVAPLFETVDDLESAHETLASMLANPPYREHLRARGDRQTVMLGYSDSAKISGVGASRWALYQAQERLLSVASEHGIDLELFHGRGGTIARGGSKPRAAILAGPPGATRHRLRSTEQGEIINGKFGLRGIAERTLEVTAGAVLEATLRDPERPPVPGPWRDAMGILARSSRAAWNALVHEDPRFIPYFRSATPVDVIERLAIGSRPASRRSGGAWRTCAPFPGSSPGPRAGTPCPAGTVWARDYVRPRPRMGWRCCGTWRGSGPSSGTSSPMRRWPWPRRISGSPRCTRGSRGKRSVPCSVKSGPASKRPGTSCWGSGKSRTCWTASPCCGRSFGCATPTWIP